MQYLSNFIKHCKLASKRVMTLSASKGFTLIELLVVIGILGVLAAALVATIDPFEQLKKASDANIENTAVEFINANIRYYTTHNQMPWGPKGCNSASAPNGLALYPGAMTDCLSLLVGDGEIKAAFTTVTGVLASITVSGTDQDVTACFVPASKAKRNDANTKFDSHGNPIGTSATCGPTSTSCFWCTE